MNILPPPPELLLSSLLTSVARPNTQASLQLHPFCELMTVDSAKAYLTTTKFALRASIIQEEKKNQSEYCYFDPFSYLVESASHLLLDVISAFSRRLRIFHSNDRNPLIKQQSFVYSYL